MEHHPYQLTLQNGLYGLAIYSPLLGETVEVPSEFLDFELARIGELLNTPPLGTSSGDVGNSSMPSTASQSASSSSSAPSSAPPLLSSSPTSDALDSGIQWVSSKSVIRRAEAQTIPEAPQAHKGATVPGKKEPGWARREVACVGCRNRRCRCEGTHPDGRCNRCVAKGLECKFEPIQQDSHTQAPGETGVARTTKRARKPRPAPYMVNSQTASISSRPAPRPSLPLLPALTLIQPEDEKAFDHKFSSDPLAYGILMDVLAGKLKLDI